MVEPGVIYPKADVGFADGEAPYGCRNCRWFDGQSACPVVAAPIASDGCCDYWNVPRPPTGLSKADVEYVQQPGTDFSCADCKYFEPTVGTAGLCTVIAPPEVDATDSCNKWEYKDWP